MDRERELRKLGYQTVSMTSCQWIKNPASQIPYPITPPICTTSDIQNAVMTDESFGIVKCSMHVPEHLIDHFS